MERKKRVGPDYHTLSSRTLSWGKGERGESRTVNAHRQLPLPAGARKRGRKNGFAASLFLADREGNATRLPGKGRRPTRSSLRFLEGEGEPNLKPNFTKRGVIYYSLAREEEGEREQVGGWEPVTYIVGSQEEKEMKDRRARNPLLSREKEEGTKPRPLSLLRRLQRKKKKKTLPASLSLSSVSLKKESDSGLRTY